MRIHTTSSIIRHVPVIHGGRNFIRNSDPYILDFSSNITPIGIPLSVKTALKKNLDDIQNYPDFRSSALISSLKKYTCLQKSNLLVGNGAIEIIYNFCFALVSKKPKS